MAVLTASLAVACNQGRNQTMESERQAQSGRNRGTQEMVKLDGCLMQGPSNNGEYVLRDVTEPAPATQPQGNEQMQRGPFVARGSWVRLVGEMSNFKDNLGQRVEVMGRVEDSGENTLGTSGRTTPAKEGETNHDKFEQSSKDAHTNPDRNMNPTTAAPVGANANGMAPRIAVEHVTKLADNCQAKVENPGPGK